MKEDRYRMISKDSLTYMVFKEWEPYNELIHCFTTRHGGVSTGIFSSLNLGFNRGDDREKVIKNYELLCEALQISIESLVISKQVHETNIVKVTASDKGNGIVYPNKWDSVDGIYTKEENITLVTHYADCVPLFFYAPKAHIIGMAHAGWRGTVGRIGAKMIETWKEQESVDCKEIQVGIGPSIGPCCFEVHKDVADEFIKEFGEASFIRYKPDNEKYTINLWECNKQIVIDSGVKEDNIFVSEICTCCHSDLFFSHRATQGKRGTLSGIMALR